MKPRRPRNAERTSAPIYSTSEARANFAEAIETAQIDGAVVGFDRYGRTVAALAPIEAIYMLAGLGEHVAPELRRKIERNARSLVQDIQRFGLQPRGERGDGKAPVAGPPKPKAKRRPKS